MTCEIKVAEIVRMSAWQSHFSVWTEPRSAKISQTFQHFKLGTIFTNIFSQRRRLYGGEREVSDKEAMLILSMKMLHWHEKAVGILAFSPSSLPPSFPPAGPDCKSPCNYPHHRSLEGSPSTTGHIRGAKCLSPPREKYSFVWRGSLLIQRLCSPVIVPWSEEREIFMFPVTDCCGKHCNIRV